MSRTYHHGYKAKQRLFGDISYWNWLGSEPKWWRKVCKHKKRRSETRECINRVLRGDEDVLFPLDKKPWIYYW